MRIMLIIPVNYNRTIVYFEYRVITSINQHNAAHNISTYTETHYHNTSMFIIFISFCKQLYKQTTLIKYFTFL